MCISQQQTWCVSFAVLLLQDHYSAVTSLSFTPEGDRLLTAGRDKVVNLWDLTTHKKAATVPVFEAIEGEHAHQQDCNFSAPEQRPQK